MQAIKLSDLEKASLIGPTTEEEIEFILKNEVNIDSSSAIFWNRADYRYLYLNIINYTRECGNWGLVNNI